MATRSPRALPTELPAIRGQARPVGVLDHLAVRADAELLPDVDEVARDRARREVELGRDVTGRTPLRHQQEDLVLALAEPLVGSAIACPGAHERVRCRARHVTP